MKMGWIERQKAEIDIHGMREKNREQRKKT